MNPIRVEGTSCDADDTWRVVPPRPIQIASTKLMRGSANVMLRAGRAKRMILITSLRLHFRMYFNSSGSGFSPKSAKELGFPPRGIIACAANLYFRFAIHRLEHLLES